MLILINATFAKMCCYRMFFLMTLSLFNYQICKAFDDYMPIQMNVRPSRKNRIYVKSMQELAQKLTIKTDIVQALGTQEITALPGVPNSFYHHGEIPSIENFPWHCGVCINERYLCNCAFLSNNYAITAALCIKSVVKIFSVQIFANTEDYTRPAKNVINVDMDMIDFFPVFDNITFQHNLAGIQLETNIQVGNVLGIPNLQEFEHATDVNNKLIFSTWGASRSVSALSHTLRVKNVEVVSSSKCARQWGNFINNEGDKGGVLLKMYGDEDNIHYIPVGIVSVVPSYRRHKRYTIATALQSYYGRISRMSGIHPHILHKK